MSNQIVVRLFLTFTFSGADLFKKTPKGVGGGAGRSPLYYILKYCSRSEGLIRCLHNCINISEQSTYQNAKWSVDFTFLTKQLCVFKETMKGGQIVTERMSRKKLAERSLLLKMQKYENDSDPRVSESASIFLDHPVTQLFVNRRWDEIGWIFYCFILFSHFLFSMIFSVYTILVYHDLCPLNMTTNYYGDESVFLTDLSSWSSHLTEKIVCNMTTANGDFFLPKANFALTAWVCLLIFTITTMLREISEFYDQKWRNFLEIDTWIHFFMIAMFGICSFHSNGFNGTMVVYRYQHHTAAWGIFATWIQMLLYMERTPRFGLYIHLLRKVAGTVLSLLGAFLSLLIAFALTFYLLFPAHYPFDNDIPSVFVKVNGISIF